jgi:predicted RNA methylase
MVLDAERNAAYDAAIRRAVRRLGEQGCGEVLALDVGAGSALLSMMAAR